jgi:hypothetical protein
VNRTSVPTPCLLAFASLLELLPGVVPYRLEHPVAYSALLRLLDHQGLVRRQSTLLRNSEDHDALLRRSKVTGCSSRSSSPRWRRCYPVA